MNPHSGEEQLLRKVRESGFALHELVLFLDTHPRDGRALNAYAARQNEYEAYKAEYERNYGSLNSLRVKGNKYDWCSRPWPWMYDASYAKGEE